jgi:phosphoserine phosphatase RsbU/P
MANEKRTLAFVLGASQFPNSPTLTGAESFANSAEDFREYLYKPRGLALPHSDVLDLFDDPRPASELLERVVDFLCTRQRKTTSTNVERLLVYYVGHGGFTPGQEYFLAVRSTRAGLEGSSSIRISDLGHIIRSNARFLCQYLILDCCFSAQAFKTFQSGPAEAAVSKTLDSVPQKGTALLCSSGPREASLAPVGERYTMFSEALLAVLGEGNSGFKEFLSIYDVGRLIDWRLADKYNDARVRPQVLCPNQPEGDLSHLPLFPNPASAELIPERSIGLDIDDLQKPAIPPDLLRAVHSLSPVARFGAVSGLRELFLSAPSRMVAVLARSELSKLCQDDSNKVIHAANAALHDCTAESIQNRFDKPVRVEISSGLESLETSELDPGVLNFFLDALGQITASSSIEDLWVTLQDGAIRLSKAESSFIFVQDQGGEIRCLHERDKNRSSIAGRSDGVVISVVQDALKNNVITTADNKANKFATDTIIARPPAMCIPFQGDKNTALAAEVRGGLCLVWQYPVEEFSKRVTDILRVLTEVAMNRLSNILAMREVEMGRRYQQELSLAGSFQRRLMPNREVTASEYAQTTIERDFNRDVCGDFVVTAETSNATFVAVGDVSGKGVGAAILASTLYGLLMSELRSGSPLITVAQSLNQFLADKSGGDKYATLILIRLSADGHLEILNCGHVPPLHISGDRVTRVEDGGNVPIGLLAETEFNSAYRQLTKGDRFLIVTDGVTEALNSEEELFDMDRLEKASLGGVSAIREALAKFASSSILQDDWTIVELLYLGDKAPGSRMGSH